MTTQEWTNILCKGYEALGDSKFSCGRDYIKSIARDLNHLYAHAWADGYRACLGEVQSDIQSD